MADATKIISLANLSAYDTLIKKYVNDADAVVDAKSVKTVLVDGDNIKFYKKANATTADTADYTVAIASSDVTQLKQDVIDINNKIGSGFSSTNTVATAIGAAQTAAEAHADTAVSTLENGQVKTNKESIEAINDATTGILATAKAYTDDEIKKLDATVSNEATGEGAVQPDVVVSVTEADGKLTAVSATVTANRFDAYGAASAVQGSTTETVASVDTKVGTINTTLGDMSAVTTTAKTVVGAIDELKSAIGDAETAGEVTLADATTPTTGYLKTYVLSQGGAEIGKIDIPKDLVVTSGEVVKNPEGQPAGTYIKLVIANQEAPIYINVKDLVDIYTAAQSATQVQIAISDTNVVSATLVAGGVGSAELAADAVVTAKIADKNVTKAKLADDVQTSLGLADSALQAADITTGSTNGTIAVEGTDVAVKGLGSAAYVNTDTFDAAGSAATAEQNAKDYADGLYEIASATDINDLFKDATE